MRLVSGMTAVFGTPLRIGEEDNGQEIWGELVTGNFFEVLGVRPAMGRFFSKEESADPPAAWPVAVIGYRLWQTRFNADPRITGKTVRVNRRPLTIVGVAPPEFQGSMSGVAHDIWAPLPMIYQLNRADEGMLDNRWTRNLSLFARLRPGVTMAQAGAEAAARASELAAAYPRSNGGIGVTVSPVSELRMGGAQSLLRRPLRILMGVCVVVLLIVWANVANLMLARATARQKEFGIRLALGAGGSRLARQLLTETLLLASAGGALGVLLTPWLAGALVWLLPAVNVPVRLDSGLSGRVLLYTMAVCLVSAFVSGLAPLVCLLRPDFMESLKEGGRGERSGARAHRLRGLLVVAEVALAMVALIGAGLFARSFYAARTINPGFATDGVVVSRFSLANTGYPLERQQQFCLRLREALEASPGVSEVSYADVAPMGFDGGPWQDIEVEGYLPGKGENLKLYRTLASPGYFRLLSIPLVAGRDFTERDDAAAMPVAIVNQAFVRRFFGGGNAIGRKIRCFGDWHTVVGVVKNVKYHDPAEAPVPYFYAPFRQAFSTGLTTAFYVRAHGDPGAAAALVRRTAAAIEPTAQVLESMPLGIFIGQSLYPLKLAATLLAVLGTVAVVLAALGLYSVMAYAVSQRTHELGIRMALGARPAAVLGMVVRQGMALTAMGARRGHRGHTGDHASGGGPAGGRESRRSRHLCRRDGIPHAGGHAGQLCARAARHARGSHGGAALGVARGHPHNACAASTIPNPISEMMTFMALQLLSVCGTVMPKYWFTSQKPASLTCERMVPPQHTDSTSISGV